MSKELLALLDSINEKKVEVKDLVNADRLEEAKQAKEELKELQMKFDLTKDLEDEEVTKMANKVEIPAVEPKYDAVKEFANAARHGFRNAMTEGTLADGGYTVPEDIETQIREYRDAKKSLANLVEVVKVKTKSGARTFKKRSQQTGFVKVGEGAKIGAKATPQFERQEYTIAKYAGYLPVSNELLADTDANITSTLTQWIADESRVTRNKLILAVAQAQTATDLSDLNGIKKALNVTLGQAFKPTSKIITNDDGLQYLDTLVDANKRYQLNPDPTDSAKLTLRAGATVVPIEVVPNDDMPSDTTTTAGKTRMPFIVGDLKEGITLFDRQMVSIKTSDTAAIIGASASESFSAFEDDLTLFRAIEREDVVLKDAAAFVNGYIEA